MMNNPYDCAHALARSIKSSDIYQRYVQNKNMLEKDAEKKEKILAFRNLQMELNQAYLLGQQLPEDRVQELSLEFAKLNQDPVMAEFFQAEAAFIQLFGEIQEILNKAIEQELQ